MYVMEMLGFYVRNLYFYEKKRKEKFLIKKMMVFF